MDISQSHSVLTLDTNVFIEKGFRFDDITLKSLSTLKDNGVDVVIADVVYYELLEHYTRALNEIKKSSAKAFLNFAIHFCDGESPFIDYESLLSNIGDIGHFAKTKIDNYLKEIGAEILKSDEYVSVNIVLNNYFNSLPPFEATGKKQNEFKDSIALEALALYSEMENKKIYVISKDNGWITYCSNSKYLLHVELKEALNTIQMINKQYDSFLEEFTGKIFDLRSEFYKDIISRFKNSITDVFPEIINNESPYYEVESAESKLISISLIEGGVKIIFINEEECNISVSAKIEIETKLLMNIYISDPYSTGSIFDSDDDFTPSSEINNMKKSSLNCEVLIELKGSWVDGLSHMVIDDVTYDDLYFIIDSADLKGK